MGRDRLILDTCALLWLSGDKRNRISDATLALIEQAPSVYIVSITGSEIALKCRGGKLRLSVTPKEWVETAVAFHQIDVIPLDLDLCLKAAELPPIHKDPCDRFIIAAALGMNLPVVTADSRFSEYGVVVLE